MQLRKELHYGTIAQGAFAIGTRMIKTLFSARDRLGRGAYWLAVLPMVFALIGFFEGGVAGYFSLDELRLVFFPLIALTTFFAGRRSRDLGYSALWVWGGTVAALAMLWILAMTIPFDPHEYYFTSVGLPFLCIAAWFVTLLFLGVAPSMKGYNRFGPPQRRPITRSERHQGFFSNVFD